MNRAEDQMQAGSVTLSDVIRLALPFGTIIAAEEEISNRPINWVMVLGSWQNLEDQLKSDDLVILPPALYQGSKRGELPGQIEALAAFGIAALLCFQPVPASIISASEKNGLPLLMLPEVSTLRTVQRTIGALLLDRQSQTTRRGLQLYRQLTEMSRDGKGIEAMVELMSRLTGKIVAVQDKRLEIRAMAVPPGNQLSIEMLERALDRRENLPTVLRNRQAAARAVDNEREGQSHWQQLLPIEQVARIVSPIISGDRARGYVSVIGEAGKLDLLDQLVAEHGAAACALEMARDKAVSEAQKRLRGDFLEGLLTQTLPADEIERLERHLDHNTREPHAIATFVWAASDNVSLRRLETAINWLMSTSQRPALVHISGGNHVTIFQSLRAEDDLAPMHEFDRRLREYLRGDTPQGTLFSGASGPAASLNEWPAVHQQALQAMRVGERLGLDRLTSFHSLGVYQLLTQIEHLPGVQKFCDEIIGPLAEYDRKQRGSLVETIDAYFTYHGNVSQTAESLFVHRNTLLYRLERIQELTGQDIDRADMRLALQLALRLWKLRRNR